MKLSFNTDLDWLVSIVSLAGLSLPILPRQNGNKTTERFIDEPEFYPTNAHSMLAFDRTFLNHRIGSVPTRKIRQRGWFVPIIEQFVEWHVEGGCDSV